MEVTVRLKYFRKSPISIQEIVNKLPNAPSLVWQIDDEGGFEYSTKTHCQHFEIPDLLLSTAISNQKTMDDLLVLYDVELTITIYLNGQANPGVSIDNHQLRQLVQLGASVDFDIYNT